MALTISGSMSTVVELHKHGVTSEYATKWLGSWTTVDSFERSPDIANFLTECKEKGVGAHFQLFYWGDSISPTAIKNGVGSKTVAGYWKLVKAIGHEIGAAGVPTLVNIETEWNKNGIIGDAGFDTMWRDSAWGIKRRSNGHATIVTAPGSWGDVVQTLQSMPGMMQATDYIGTQLLRSLPRGGEEKYRQGPDHLLATAKKLVPLGKPVYVTDIVFSSYGGNFSTEHPFGGGDGLAAEHLQKEAFDRLRVLAPEFEQAGVKGLFFRSVYDVPNFELHNYHGYAERHWGVIRSDGSRKASYDAFVSMAKQEPSTVPIAQYEAVLSDLKAKETELGQIKKTLTEAVAAKEKAELYAMELEARIDAALEALTTNGS